MSGQPWNFGRWSDGGAPRHVTSTPVSATTYTASFSPSAGSMYEAELAALSGALVATKFAGFTGTGYACFTNPTADYIEWTIGAPAAGLTAMEFRYSLGAFVQRSVSVMVNGVIARPSVVFAPTDGGSVWRKRTINLTLLPGTKHHSPHGYWGQRPEHRPRGPPGTAGRRLVAPTSDLFRIGYGSD